MNRTFFTLTRPLYGLFIAVTCIILPFEEKLTVYHISTKIVLSANIFLCVISMLNIYFQQKNIHNLNPNAIIRGVMAGTFLKLFVLAGATLFYLFTAGENRSVNAVFVGMGLYILYTWLEVRISLRMNPKK